MTEVSEIAEQCDWKTAFGPEEIVAMIATILEEHPELYEALPKKNSSSR